MKQRIVFSLLHAAMFVLLFGCLPAFASDYKSDALVRRVVSGDTILLDNGEEVRLIGIDCPESHPGKQSYRIAKKSRQDMEAVMAMGPQATAATKKLAEGKKVRLEFDAEEHDKSGRLLAYVYVESDPAEVFLNAYLVAQGFALVHTVPPNGKYADLFLKLQREAKENFRGLWRTLSEADETDQTLRNIEKIRDEADRR